MALPSASATRAQAVAAMRKAKSARGKKTVPPGYKNYGQLRSELAHQQNAARKAAKPPAPPAVKPLPPATTPVAAASKATQLERDRKELELRQVQAQGPKTVPTGVKNYGQQRSAEVHRRNAARKAAKRATKPRFADNQTVSGAVAQRTGARLARTGPVKGVDGTDGYTGKEARLAREARGAQKGRRGRRRRRRPTSPPGRIGY